MKLQKRFIRKVNNKDYYKYILNVPPMIIKESGIKEGEEIDIKVENGKIVLRKKQIKKN
ncbi:MAG: AbrB/MazE/SpoVT family DNA-binding domain-containing protein [Nanoarchaeota archaeon]